MCSLIAADPLLPVARIRQVSTPLVTLCEPLDVQFHLYSSKVPKFIHLPSSLMPYNVTYTSTSVYLAWTYSAPGLFGMHSTAFEAISPTQTRFTVRTHWLNRCRMSSKRSGTPAVGLTPAHDVDVPCRSVPSFDNQGWEQAEGTLVKLASSFWTTQFQYVADETASGISCLERVYQATGHLNNTNVAATCSSTSSSGILAL